MVRKKKDEDTEVKKRHGGRNQQTPQGVEPASHGPMEISDFTCMFDALMPMIMMVMMMAIMMPMLKGVATK